MFSRIAVSFANIFKTIRTFFHAMVGLPSYDKYLEYHKKYCAGCTPKSRKEFFNDAQDKKYGRDGNRKCC